MSQPSPGAFAPLIATDLAKAYAGRPVFDGLQLVCAPGQRVGLVGENGSGKSTLIRILVGKDEPDAGSVSRPADLGYLSQVPTFPTGASVGAVLDDALAELHAAVAELESLGHAMAERPDDDALHERFADRLAYAETHDAWDAERRATVAAHELGLDVSRERPVAELSGGQQVRLALACLIARRPACVVMDEPTNHLDEAAMALLEDFLRGLPGVELVASHDRTFLDNVCTHLVDMDANPLGVDGVGGRTFAGTFTDYLDAKRAARVRWEQTWVAQQDEIKKLRDDVASVARSVAHSRGPTDNDKYIYTFKGGNVDRAVSRRVAAAEAKLAEAEANHVRKPRPELRFRPRTVDVGSAAVEIAVRDLVVPGRVRLDRLDVPTGTKLLVSGPNGCGKSSLLKVLVGELTPASGTVSVRGGRGAVGYLPQDVTFANPSRTALQVYGAAGGDVPLGELGLVHGRELNKPVGQLSVGQQRRLALACLLARSPRILLLDEPTNHISLTLASELEDALQASPGTVVIATHDRWLRRRWTGASVAMRTIFHRSRW